MSKITFDVHGTLAPSNKISMRTLGYLCMNFQTAINRSYLEVKHGAVFKKQRTLIEDYGKTDFMFSKTREGSFVIEFIEHSKIANKISEKLSTFLDRAYSRIVGTFDDDYLSIPEYVEKTQERISEQLVSVQDFCDAKSSISKKFNRGYASKSVMSSISTALTPLRNAPATDDRITIIIDSEGVVKNKFVFNPDKARRLHRLVNNVSYLQPTAYRLKLFAMNQEKINAEAYNIENGNKKIKIKFATEEAFISVRRHFADGDPISIIGMPCVEYESVDVDRGDVMYVSTAI